jgi:DNA endonuclease
VAAPSGSGTTPLAPPRRKTVPLALRIELYRRAKALRDIGLTYSEIIESLRAEYKVGPSKGQLSEWFRGIHGPFGSANRFLAEPTPELAYVIGVKLGDGSLNRKGYNRRIRLQSVDLEFVLEFDRCLSKILGTRRHTPWFDTKRREIHVEASSVLLHDFLSQRWENLKPWIGHCSSCISMFLRGFFDSEGSLSEEGHVTCSNSDFALLEFVQHLLFHFKIETTGPHLQTRAGTKMSNRGRAYVRKSDVYYVYIRVRSLVTFSLAVGFAIHRKQLRVQKKVQETADKSSRAVESGAGGRI